MKRQVRQYARDARTALERAPVESALALSLALAFSIGIETPGDGMQGWLEFAIIVVLVGAGAWAGTLLSGLGRIDHRGRWLLTGVVVALAALYGLTLLDLDRDAEGWRAASLVAAAWLAVAWAPALAARDGQGTDAFREVAGRTLVRALGAGLYGAGLFAGLALAIAAVNALFELDLDGIYGHVFGWIAFAFVPLVIFGGVQHYVAEESTAAEPVRPVVHRLATWLVVPLLAVYYAILYAYVVRIAVTGELPQNLVSPMVIAAGVLGALALILLDPRPGTGGRSRLLRTGPALFLPLAALGAWALYIRIDAYGVTEFRYLRGAVLLALVLLSVRALLALMRGRRLRLERIPLLAAVVLLLSAVGPWSAPSLSLRSQRTQLASALERAGFDPSRALPLRERGEVDQAALDTIPPDLHETIRSTALYLERSHGANALVPWVDPAAAEQVALDLPHRLGLTAIAAHGPAPMLLASLEPGTVVPGPSGATLERISIAGGRQRAIARDSTGAMHVGFATAAGSGQVDLAPVLHSPRPGRQPVGLGRGTALLPILGADGQRLGDLLLLEVAASTEDGRTYLRRLDGIARTRPADAPAPGP